jgi:GGDEF domain-containing protein
MIAAYFVLRPTVALAINSVGLVALVGILVPQLAVNLLTIVVTIGLVNLFAYIFAYRTGLQNKELHTAVELDFLTGVGNRRAGPQAGRACAGAPSASGIEPAAAGSGPLQAINDQYGHAAGDKVLVRLAELMRRHTRSSDRIFRYGGEEFAIIASGAEADAARVWPRICGRQWPGPVAGTAPCDDIDRRGHDGQAHLAQRVAAAGRPDAVCGQAGTAAMQSTWPTVQTTPRACSMGRRLVWKPAACT